MVTENGQGVVQPGDSNNNCTEQKKNAKVATVKGYKEQAETIFNKIKSRLYRDIRIFRICLCKNLVRISLYIAPLLLFFSLFDFTKTSLLFTERTGINYIASYCLYIVVIELARKLHANTKKSTHARHVFNQSFVYFPLALFLFTASYALYSGGSEVFGVQPAEQRQAFVQEIDKFLNTYKTQCTQASVSTKEQHQCIENYLNATLFADVKLIQEKYGDASNSYSIIAIMTGFFGVLMTVLVIYFSLSGRELLEHKLAEAEKVIKTTSDTSQLANDASYAAKAASELANAASIKANEASSAANAASDKANEASSAANAASDKANEASSAASAASDRANEASSAATTAAATANEVALAANAAAAEALSTANSVKEMVSKLNNDVTDMKKNSYVVQSQGKNKTKEGIGAETPTNKSDDKSS
jgi:hypothetical protein